MIYRLEIENFMSVRDGQALELRAPESAPDVRFPPPLASLWPGSRERAPKVVALFGANGSGKSVVLKALTFAAWFVGSSVHLQAGARLPFEPFNDEEAETRPMRLGIWLSAPEPQAAGEGADASRCAYRYELEVADGGGRVTREAIFFWPRATGRKTRLIERTEDGGVKAARAFASSSHRRALNEILRPNASVISSLAQLNHPAAAGIAMAAASVPSNALDGEAEASEEVLAEYYASRPERLKGLSREIGRLHLGVDSVEIVSGRSGPKFAFRHEGLAAPVPFALESDGARRFVRLHQLLADGLATGRPVIVDGLDTALHPTLAAELANWFRDPDRNPNGAQLWMSCHCASLLEDMEKDEVAFCEKDYRGRTELYALSDIKGVRRDENYFRKYIDGVFGAVPHIG